MCIYINQINRLYMCISIFISCINHLLGLNILFNFSITYTITHLVIFIYHSLLNLLQRHKILNTYKDVFLDMTGIEFENYVAYIALKTGLSVKVTGMTRDWGVDIILGSFSSRTAVQCKRLSRPVNIGAVQEIVSGAPFQNCTKTILITNCKFTLSARRFAKFHKCDLIDETDIYQLRSILNKKCSYYE